MNSIKRYKHLLEKVENHIFFKVSRNLTFLIGAFAVMFLTSCSSKPSVNEGKQAVSDQYKPYAKVIDFQKTNGVKGEGTYEMDYTATLQFLNEVCTGQVAGEPMVVLSKGPCGVLWVGTTMRKGSQAKFHGKLFFEKTERGWRLSHM